MPSRNKQIQASLDPVLTNFAVGYRRQDLIFRLVAPVLDPLTESGKIFSFGKGGFKIHDSKRALRTKIKVKPTDALTTTSFRCEEESLKEYLDDEELKAAETYGHAQILKLEQRLVNALQSSLEIGIEKAVADYLFGASYYASGNKLTLSGTDQWTDTANSDPVGQLDTGKAAARADMGVEPNTLVLGYTSFNSLKRHPQIIEKIKYSMKAVITADLLAELLDLKNVIVGKAVYASDAGVFTDLWTDSAALIYVPENMEQAEGTTPHTVVLEQKGFPQVLRFAPEELVFPFAVRRKYDVINVDTSFGYLLSDCNA